MHREGLLSMLGCFLSQTVPKDDVEMLDVSVSRAEG